MELAKRIFLHWKTSTEGLVLVVLAWLSAQGFDLSQARKDQLLALVAVIGAAIWKLFSADPVPQE